jgi:RNA recognition motif-containing protein
VDNLYVGNLSYEATEEEVAEFFDEIGKVSKVTIIKDRETGRPRGFCFVEMENGDDAINECNGQTFMGRKLMINKARPRPERSDKNRGGYRE